MKNKLSQYFKVSLIIILISNSLLFSQNKYDLYQLKNETINFFKLPINWDKNDFLKLSIIGAGTFVTMQIDQQIRNEYLKDRSYNKSFPINFGKQWGEIYTTAIIGSAFGLHGIIGNNNSTKRIGFEIFQSAFYSGIITQILKISLGRARPFTNNGSKFYKPFTLFNDDFHSLPSGHATLAFSLSTILSNNTDSKILKVIFYIPAVLTATSRVYQDNHWASDVFLGAAIGYFVGEWVHSIHKESNNSNQILELRSDNSNWIIIKINF
ncbi:phosphatase PAP2 family protein [Rosettibacter firmus]|uniref:phosphatase PAP2 family protein n=1 Tax=Rosettibacter firmus TaxID=3111522 RepID=UPI00336BC3C0